LGNNSINKIQNLNEYNSGGIKNLTKWVDYMAKYCPECKNYSLDYNPIYKIWRCVWVECSYEEEKEIDEKNPLLTSILASRNSVVED